MSLVGIAPSPGKDECRRLAHIGLPGRVFGLRLLPRGFWGDTPWIWILVRNTAVDIYSGGRYYGDIRLGASLRAGNIIDLHIYVSLWEIFDGRQSSGSVSNEQRSCRTTSVCSLAAWDLKEWIPRD